MHLLFVDESGTPAKQGKGTPCHFVLAGVVIPESYWHQIRDDLNQTKGKHGVSGEIHWRDFYVNPEKPKAGAIYRCFESRDKRFFDLIELSLRRSTKGVVPGYGIVKWPKTNW